MDYRNVFSLKHLFLVAVSFSILYALQVPTTHAIVTPTTIYSAGTRIFQPDVVVDSLNKPKVVFRDGNGHLKFIRCSDSTCSANTIVTLDASGLVQARGPEVEMTPAGLPVILYSTFTAGTGTTKMILCNDADCTTSTTKTLLTGSIFIDSGRLHLSPTTGIPAFLVARTPLNGKLLLEYITCSNTTCDSVSSKSLESVDGTYSADFTFNCFGIPTLAYGYAKTLAPSAYQDHVVTCNDFACSSPTFTTTSINTGSTQSGYISVILGDSGFPSIAYQNYYSTTPDHDPAYTGTPKVRYRDCDNATCSSSTLRNLHMEWYTGEYLVMIKGADGYPVVLPNVMNFLTTSTERYGLSAIECRNEDCSELDRNEIANGIDYPALQEGERDYHNAVLNHNGDIVIASSYKITSTTNKLNLYVVPRSGQVYPEREDLESHDNTNNPRYNGDSITVEKGVDGFPRIAYFDNWMAVLRFVTCLNMDCSINIRTSPDSVVGVPGGTPLNKNQVDFKIGTDGFPRIAYITDRDLWYIQCTNDPCTTRSSRTLIASAAADQSFASPRMSLDSSNNAYITYSDYDSVFPYSASSFKLVRCTNATCSTKTTATLTSSTPIFFGGVTSIRIASDGFPRLAINEENLFYFWQCLDAMCATKNATLLATGEYANLNDMELDSSGFGRIIYNNYNIGGGSYPYMYYIRCTNTSCSTRTTVALDSGSDYSGDNLGLVLAPDGSPRMVTDFYNVDYDTGMRYTYCSDSDCSSFTDVVLSSTSNLEYLADIILGNNTDPVVVSLNLKDANTAKHITFPRVFHCIDQACSTRNSPTQPTTLFSNTAATGAQTGSNNPQDLSSSSLSFSALFNDTDGGSNGSSYRLQISTSADFACNTYDSGKLALGSTPTNTVRSGNITGPTSGTLSENISYYWRIKFWDNNNMEGMFTGLNSFAANFKIILAAVVPSGGAHTAVNALGGASLYAQPEPTSGSNGPIFTAPPAAPLGPIPIEPTQVSNSNQNTQEPAEEVPAPKPLRRFPGISDALRGDPTSLCSKLSPAADLIAEKDLSSHFRTLVLEYGIVLGNDLRYLNPQSTVTRSEVLRILLQAACEKFKLKVVTEDPFPDMPKTHPDALFISLAKENKIVSGYLHDNTFKPEKSISRAEVFKIVLELLLGNRYPYITGTNTSSVPGVPMAVWYYRYIDFAAERGIISPTDPFYPESPATLEDIGTFFGQVATFSAKQ